MVTVSYDEELRVKKIKEGTVIDHISAGNAIKVLNILGIKTHTNQVLSVAINVPSKTRGLKDIVKIEDRELSTDEVNKIALIAPQATINIIRAFKVVEKQKVKLPKIIRGILKCGNPSCISNSREPVQPLFVVETGPPPTFRCYYCRRFRIRDEILNQL